jgi:hypothetical protein
MGKGARERGAWPAVFGQALALSVLKRLPGAPRILIGKSDGQRDPNSGLVPAGLPFALEIRYPAGKVTASEHAEINRCITLEEFQHAVDLAYEGGLQHLDARSVLRAIMH